MSGWRVNPQNGTWLTDPELDEHHRAIIAWLLEVQPSNPGDVRMGELCDAVESGEAAAALRRARAVLQ